MPILFFQHRLRWTISSFQSNDKTVTRIIKKKKEVDNIELVHASIKTNGGEKETMKGPWSHRSSGS
jgi:hypothetical protein